MSTKLAAFSKSPGSIGVVIAIGVCFVLALVFGAQMVAAETWSTDLAQALGFSWANMGGLYFGLLAPILVAGLVATMVAPEKQRGNLQWMRSQPRGISILLREKLVAIIVSCTVICLVQVAGVLGFGAMTDTIGEPLLATLLTYAVLTGLGLSSVTCFYLWVSTYTDSLASTVAIAMGLTIVTMGVSILNQLVAGSNTIERFLPTSQIVSTSFARSPGQTDPMVLLIAGVVALAWAGVFLALSVRRLRCA